MSFPSLLIVFHFSYSSYSTPPLPFTKQLNNKLSYRRQNALSVIKHTNTIPSEIILYLSVRHSRLVGGIMLSTCPSVRLSVC